jgi:hypothetical protein
MRTLILAMLTVAAGCSGKGPTAITCGSALCDVSGANVCCIGTDTATCTTTCSGMPRFNCLGPTTCPGGVCCVDGLGGHCQTSCNATQTTACEVDTNCAAAGMKCNQSKSYNSSSGTPLLTVNLCGAP